MARVQQTPNKTKNQVNNKKVNTTVKNKPEAVKAKAKKEPSKNEILFFRLGMSIIALTIITVIIIFTIKSFMDKEEEAGVFDDQITITAEDLKKLVGYDADFGIYGDFSLFQGQEDYEDLYERIMNNDDIYIYFYSEAALNDDIVDVIKAKDFDGKAFFLINLDLHEEALGGADFAHLDLDLTKDSILLTFHVQLQEFSTEILTDSIIIEIGKI